MGAIYFNCEGVTGHIHVPDAVVDLEPFGAKVWLEWHNYLGPTFFRGEHSSEPIRNPSRKTWGAFEAWMTAKSCGNGVAA